MRPICVMLLCCLAVANGHRDDLTRSGRPRQGSYLFTRVNRCCPNAAVTDLGLGTQLCFPHRTPDPYACMHVIDYNFLPFFY